MAKKIIVSRNGRARDTQRQKLYKSESVLKSGERFKTIADCQTYVDRLTKERWFQSRWGQKSIKVQIKTYGSATGDYFRQQINMPPWSRDERIILHEVAHVLTPPPFAAHGPEYAATYLCLIQHQFGEEEASKLRQSFALHRVKYRQGVRAVPKAGSRKVVTQKMVAERKKAATERPISATEKNQTAATLRLAVKQGLLGAPGTKQRQYALSIARALDTQ